jgi:hypothetical protein
LVVASCLVALAGPARAKGARDATITGPGITGSVQLESEGASFANVNRVADAAGTYDAVFRTKPSPIEPHRPRGALGPLYRIVFRIYGGDNGVTAVRQLLYPFARAGFVVYTPPGQRVFHERVLSGWYTAAMHEHGGMSSADATALLVAAGVPDRRPSQPCVLQRDPADFYALAQPATLTLPNGSSVPIEPGNPLTAPQRVTLDGDGSLPGEVSTAASLLWGASTPGGPFADLDDASPGDRLVLRQGGEPECVQRWRITRVATSNTASPSRPMLRLVAFAPSAGGPAAELYVDAVPA